MITKTSNLNNRRSNSFSTDKTRDVPTLANIMPEQLIKATIRSKSTKPARVVSIASQQLRMAANGNCPRDIDSWIELFNASVEGIKFAKDSQKLLMNLRRLIWSKLFPQIRCKVIQGSAKKIEKLLAEISSCDILDQIIREKAREVKTVVTNTVQRQALDPDEFLDLIDLVMDIDQESTIFLLTEFGKIERQPIIEIESVWQFRFKLTEHGGRYTVWLVTENGYIKILCGQSLTAVNYNSVKSITKRLLEAFIDAEKMCHG